MISHWLHKLKWHGRRAAFCLGWAGVAGPLILVGVAIFYWRVQLPQQAALHDLAEVSETLRTRIVQHHAAIQKDISPAVQLEQFYRFFPDARGDALTDSLGKIYAAAATENLTLDQGDYRLSHDLIGNLIRFDIALPIKGSYPRVRRFLATSLREVPNLALEGISFNRQAVADAGIDAQVRLTVYLISGEASGI